MGVRNGFALWFAIALMCGCAEGHCRRASDQRGAAKPLEPAVDAMASGKTSAQDHVFVYKYDGSVQCGMGKSIPLDQMAKDLQGIIIFSSTKKPDGLMHIQVCGSTTGMANVFEIPAKSLKQAESKGFKKWSFE